MDRHPLAAEWRKDAEFLRRCGAVEAAATREDCASRLEAYELERSLEALTLSQAAAESGYSKDHLSRLVSDGKLENAAAESGRLLIRRRHLPRKPQRMALDDPDPVGEMLAARGLDEPLVAK